MQSHRELAVQMELVSFPSWAPGMPFLLPRGLLIMEELQRWACERLEVGGYQRVLSPQLCRAELWERSGHWESYADKMFQMEVEGEQYALKAMSCPAHAMLVRERAQHGRVQLPLRIAEMGHVHRLEPSGSLNGLLRARAFSQDDAHLFLAPSMVEEEARACLQEAQMVYAQLGVPIQAELSLRPAKRMGDERLWDVAEAQLEDALGEAGISYALRPGEGAFYGPKVDLHARDRQGREWQMGSLQLDYLQPSRFGLPEALGEPVVMIHRAHYGSFERLLGILLEQSDGWLPFWLAPEQFRVLALGEGQEEAARALVLHLRQAGLRAEADERGSLGKRILRAHQQRVPACVILGARELESGQLSLRVGEEKRELPVEELIRRAQAVSLSRALEGASGLLEGE